LLVRALAQTSGVSAQKIRSDMDELGDLGKVAQNCRSSQQTLFKPKALSIASLYKSLQEIAKMSGANAMSRKVDRVQALLGACTEPCEAKYLIRLLEGKLRIGLAEQSLLAALAQASVCCTCLCIRSLIIQIHMTILARLKQSPN